MSAELWLISIAVGMAILIVLLACWGIRRLSSADLFDGSGDLEWSCGASEELDARRDRDAKRAAERMAAEAPKS